MAKKTATYATYELRVEDNGKIVILNDGQLEQNTMGAIRSIANQVSFTLDPKWNTQSSGRKLIDFLNNATTTSATSVKAEESASSVSEPTITPKQTPKFAAKPEVKSAKRNTENELTEEEMNELLKQIAELRKTIESLESRVAKLEKGSAGNPVIKTSGSNTKDYQKDQFKIDLTSYVRDEDGTITKFWKSAKKVNYDTRSNSVYDTLILSENGRVANENEWAGSIWGWNDGSHDKVFLLLTEIGEEKGHKFSFDIPESLPAEGQQNLLNNMKNELVKTYGKGGTAFFDNYMLSIDSNHIYRVGLNVMDKIVKFISDPTIIKREWNNEPFTDNLDWTEEERYKEIKKYVLSLKKRFA